jgi:hypothetical protein
MSRLSLTVSHNNLKLMDQPVHFASRGEILSYNHGLLAILPRRGRNPLRAGIAGEDENPQLGS